MDIQTRSIPHRKQVRNHNIRQVQQTPPTQTLHGPSRNQHRHTDGRGTQRTPDKKDGNSNQEHGLTAPDLAYFAPYRGRGPFGENVGGTHPDVAGICVEVLGDGGEGGGDDGDV
jgi:hypothetical protein